MALSDTALATLIKSEIEGKFGAADDAAKLQDFADAVAKAVVDHIVAAGTTSTVIASGSSAGTYPGTIA